MFANYEPDFGKLNLNWLYDVRIELAEIQELLQQPDRAWTYIRAANQFERVGYTASYRKFIAVQLTLVDHKVVIDDVNLADYEAIREVVIRQFLEDTD
ncbi:hypothetical protein [Hymenobacter cavernae]|uniref:Uncharacterized protein n=1 Tax=Hymenobacter cavernae TaxID=2044852 RepID=A0ABQ1TR27_9BACT|nr:hypothetical protein [Hymenobacter cavernae]GGF01716.1 hypothetical protein GCM10011383_10770 [Hymenobacter cavernae]